MMCATKVCCHTKEKYGTSLINIMSFRWRIIAWFCETYLIYSQISGWVCITKKCYLMYNISKWNIPHPICVVKMNNHLILATFSPFRFHFQDWYVLPRYPAWPLSELTMKNYYLALPMFSTLQFNMKDECEPPRCAVWTYRKIGHLSHLHEAKTKS